MPKPLAPVSVAAPAFYGLNLQRKAEILPFNWATVAENAVFDTAGRVGARKGSQYSHSSAISSTPDVKSIHEYVDASGSTLQILAAGNTIYKLVSGTLTDIGYKGGAGAITLPTADNWKFVNFNGKCVGFQSSHSPIVLSTVSGDFADISVASGTAASNEVLAAFGRLWILDGSSLKYSALLDETHWSTGAGSFDLSTVWINGMDIPVALAEFNGHLVVFGKNSIIVYNNPWVPTGTGQTDVANEMTLVENIGGVGCIERDSIQFIGTDILFLSRQGVRSLGRTIQEKSMPVNDISKNVHDQLVLDVSNETEGDIKSAYSKKDGFYILTLPTSNKTYYFDVKGRLEDGSLRCTTWATSFTALNVTVSNTIYLGFAGYIGTYTGYKDGVASDGSGGSTYDLTYESGWNDMGEQVAPFNKLPKKLALLLLGGAGTNAILKWAFDYDDTFTSTSYAIPSNTSSAEYNIAEFNIDEYGGGLEFNRLKVPMSRSGQVIKMGFKVTVNGSSVSIQQFDMYYKVGRIAA